MNDPNRKFTNKNKADVDFGTLVTKPSGEPKPGTPEPKPSTPKPKPKK